MTAKLRTFVPSETDVAVANRMASWLDVSGCDVLEIGGALELDVVTQLAARSWVSVDPLTESRVELKDGRVERRRGRAQAIDAEPGSFDVCFSANAFHLIDELEEAISEIARVLRKGGFLFTEFGPIWSAPDGHQLENLEHGGLIHNFWDGDLMPDHWHLLLGEQDLKAALATGIDFDLADALAAFVHHSSWPNRLFFEQYATVFAEAGFRTILRQDIAERDYTLRTPKYNPPDWIAGQDKLQDALLIKFGSTDLRTRNIRVLLERQ